MTTLVPLDALIARADRADEIVAPQYDSLAHRGRYQYALDRPDCFLNVVLSRGDFPDPLPDEHNLAERATAHFEGMLERGLFVPHGGPAFFLYELAGPEHRQVGLMAGVPNSAISEGAVLGHEGTLRDRALDLAEFYRVSRLTSSPVALAFDADLEHRRLFERLTEGEPIRDFTGWDGVRQRLWAVDAPDDVGDVIGAMEAIETFYITDGHHRVEAVQEEGASPGWFLGVLFPAEQMHVLEYNRCVSLGQAPSLESIRSVISAEWDMSPLGAAGEVAARPAVLGDVHMLLDGTWHRLRFVGERPRDPVARLDVSLLHDRILAPAFGVEADDDPRLAFVVGEDAGTRLEEVARSDPGMVAFALHPTPVHELFAVADAGLSMPAKSTWFTPKPRSGLVVVRW